MYGLGRYPALNVAVVWGVRMFPMKLVHLIEAHADKLSEGLIQELENSGRCEELLRKVPAEELRRRCYEIYRHVSDWMVERRESEVEERYIGLGARRAKQGVSFSELLWALNITKEHLWEYLQREGVLEEPVDFYGAMQLLRSLEKFFDTASYFASVGYELGTRSEEKHKAVA